MNRPSRNARPRAAASPPSLPAVRRGVAPSWLINRITRHLERPDDLPPGRGSYAAIETLEREGRAIAHELGVHWRADHAGAVSDGSGRPAFITEAYTSAHDMGLVLAILAARLQCRWRVTRESAWGRGTVRGVLCE